MDMCITREELLGVLISITAIGTILSWLWDALFTHPEDNR
jgi:hypothetical protein